MATATLQIPIQKHLRDKAAKVAKQRGFSSLQEVVRLFLNQFADRRVDIAFNPPVVRLSEENDKRYAKIVGITKQVNYS